MGMPKGLVMVRGRPWIEHQLDAAAKVGIARTMVVLGADNDRYRTDVPGLILRTGLAVNGAPERGPFSSLQVGLMALREASSDAPVYVLPIDVPAAGSDVWRRAGTRAAAGCGRGRTRSRRARAAIEFLLAPAFVARLLALPAEARLDGELKLASERVARVAVGDPSVRWNLNTPADWGRLGWGP